MAYSKRALTALQTHVTDPQVLAALITASDFATHHRLKVQPDQAAHLIKQGKGPAAESIAPVVTDEKLLTRLARDSRKGVRSAVLQNPNLTQDQLELTLRKALKTDADYEVAAPAAKLLEDDRLLPIIGEYIEPMNDLSGRVFKEAIPFSGFSGGAKATYYAPQDLNDLIGEIVRRIAVGGVEYLKKLHRIKFYDYAVHTNRRRASDVSWYEPGMLTWMAPEMEDTHVAIFLDTLLRNGQVLSDEDMEVAAGIIRGIDPSRFAVSCTSAVYRGSLMGQKDTVLRQLYDLGPYWQGIVANSRRLPEDLQLAYAEKLTTEQLLKFKDPNPPREADLWTVTAEDLKDSDGPDSCDNWQSPDVVNIIAERFSAHLIKLAEEDNRGLRHTVQDAANRVLNFAASVHPDRRAALNPLTLLMASWGRGALNRRGIRGFGSDPLRAWVRGELEHQPSASDVRTLLGFTQGVRFEGVSDFLDATADGDRVSLLLEAAEWMTTGNALSAPKATHLILQHYFGSNVDAWTVAVDLMASWDGSLEELAVTACAASGAEIPTEVVDQADLHTAEDQEDSEPAPADTEEPSPAADEESPDSAPAEDGDSPDEGVTEDADTGAEDTSPDTEEEDIKPLDVTTPVAFTLF